MDTNTKSLGIRSSASERTIVLETDPAAEKSLEGGSSATDETPAPAPLPPKDGGAFAWLQCAAAFCLFFNSWGLVNAFGAFQAYYEQEALKDTPPSQISWIGSLQAFLFVFGGAVTGPLYDAGYLKVLVRTGAVLIVFGMMMTSLCTQYWQFVLAQGLLVGLGDGCLFVPSISLLPQYFVKRRALSIGLAIIGGNFGGVIYSIMFHQLQPILGFAWATRVIAFVMLALLLLPIFCLRMRTKPAEIRRSFDLHAWTELPFFLFAVATFVGLVGLYIPYFYVETFALRNGIVERSLAFYLVSIMNAGSIAGRLVLSYLADKMGPVRIMALCTAACAVISFGWIGCRSQDALLVFCILYGFFSGTIISLVPAVVAARLCSDLRYMGLRMGMICIPCSLGFLIGTPIGGALSTHGWLGLQILTGLTLAFSSASLVTLHAIKPKPSA